MVDDVSAGRGQGYGLKEKFEALQTAIQMQYSKTNMKTTKKVLAVLALSLACAFGVLAQQQTMVQTTLTTAVSGPALYSGTSPTISQTVTLASCTGVSAPVLPGTPSTIIYVDREAMGIFNINTTSCTAVVNRGYLGTQASPHLSGAMVLVAPNYAVTVALGGNPVPSGFFQMDPAMGSTCTAAGTTTTPWVNVLTGAQWLCSTVTGGWVAGWNNALATEWSGQTATVAAATGVVLPSGPTFIINGAGAISGFTIPVGCNATSSGSCSFNVIVGAGSTWTWTAAGNIMTASTAAATVGHIISFTWSPSLLKFVPSALV